MIEEVTECGIQFHFLTCRRNNPAFVCYMHGACQHPQSLVGVPSRGGDRVKVAGQDLSCWTDTYRHHVEHGCCDDACGHFCRQRNPNVPDRSAAYAGRQSSLSADDPAAERGDQLADAAPASNGRDEVPELPAVISICSGNGNYLSDQEMEAGRLSFL